MEIPKFKAYDPNTGLECDVVAIDYRLNEIGLKPVNGEYTYYTTKDNIVTWAVKDDNSVEVSVYYGDRYHGSHLE